ncbi:MAG: CD225/dispanin family protein, partial [Actinobacteria bacterium]|nr:CD225/dispanin family protein [Actinomycetota bacterium]
RTAAQGAPPAAPPAQQYAPPAAPPQYAPPQYAPPQPYPQQAPAAWNQQQAPKNHLVTSILVTVLCCLPLGAVAIYFSTQVDSRWQRGDYAGATDAAKKANLFATLAVVLGLIANCAYLALQIASQSGSSY